MGVLSQHRESRTVWLGAAAAAAEEARRPQRVGGGIPGGGARGRAVMDTTWPSIQVRLPAPGTVDSPRIQERRLIPKTLRLEHATMHGATVMQHEPLSAQGGSKPAGRPGTGAMRAMHRMIDHLEERKAVLTQLFRDYDKDGSGSIDRDELSAGLRALGLRLSREEVDGVMAYLDTDGGGDVDLEEFIEHFKVLRAERGYAARLPADTKPQASAPVNRRTSVAERAMGRMIDHLVERKAVLTKMFREFDKDGSGTIDKEELDGALITLGLRLSRGELDGVMAFLDTDGGGGIDLERFIETFKAERANRFEGHIPELKQAKQELMVLLQEGHHVQTMQDGKRSCSPERGARHGQYRLLTAIERLQSLEGLSKDDANKMREYIQELLARGIGNATTEELEMLQHMHRVHAPYVSSGPYIRNGMGTKGPRFGEGQTAKRISTAQWQERKRAGFTEPMATRRIAPNPRHPTPEANTADCTHLRFTGVPKRPSAMPPTIGRRAAARKLQPVGPMAPRLDALRSAARTMHDYQPAEPMADYQPTNNPKGRGNPHNWLNEGPRQQQQQSPPSSGRASGRASSKLKSASERSRTPRSAKQPARPPFAVEKPKVQTARAAFVASPPTSAPNSPRQPVGPAAWLTPRLVDTLADKERMRTRELGVLAKVNPVHKQDWHVDVL